ncbi:MAG: DUF7146 domain-containing protein [Pseudomonadota bacterium]
MIAQSFSDLARLLARDAEAVCRYYLPAGRRAGNYWLVGDVNNNPGRSLYVRLKGPESGKGAAGRWTDAATGQHGDLLDLIRESCGLYEGRALADEARHFLNLPHEHIAPQAHPRATPARPRSPDAPRRLFAMSQPIRGTLADRYLQTRGILCGPRERALRFHPGCYYRDLDTGRTLVLPALIAAVTSLDGTITGVHRTWLDPSGTGKAPLAEPRRSLGEILGNGVRFGFAPGMAVPVMAAGEGLETMLSLGMVMPAMPAVAATSANHLAALSLPPGCERLYIAADADAAGRHGIEILGHRAREAGLLVLALTPMLGDFNEDLRRLGPDRLAAQLRPQLAPKDANRFLLAA